MYDRTNMFCDTSITELCHLSYKSFVLHIIYPTGRGTMICPTYHLSYRAGNHYLSYTSFVLHLSCPTLQLSYGSIVLHIISPTERRYHHLSYTSIVLINCPTERERNIICPIIQLHSTSFVL